MRKDLMLIQRNISGNSPRSTRKRSMISRNFTRVDFCECASIKHDNQMFFGDIKNVSLQGLFIMTSQNMPLDTPVEITIYFPQNSSIYLNARVVHCEDVGIGFQIYGMDVNSFLHLRNAVTMNCSDHDLIMRETFKVTNCIH